ncbi:Uma2 family endonuclease [uncultured Thiodictyon sp.]|jgi:Uma2 family endonuclease|uniref:Uma2 family endonuclease n=1 Tax=uncultured Thiodictyon sp. TaxID=1846217 RepID=UPI0025EB5882|nr:Uma2 family endonuclease [uncultured Thiodictyon sp.]
MSTATILPPVSPRDYLLGERDGAQRLIVEVLSPRTAAVDDGEKRINYQTLGSLDEYLLLDPDTGEGTLYRRGGAFWTRIRLDRDDALELGSIGLRGTMAWLLGGG